MFSHSEIFKMAYIFLWVIRSENYTEQRRVEPQRMLKLANCVAFALRLKASFSPPYYFCKQKVYYRYSLPLPFPWMMKVYSCVLIFEAFFLVRGPLVSGKSRAFCAQWYSPQVTGLSIYCDCKTFEFIIGFHDVCLTLLLVLGVESAERVGLLLARYGAFNGLVYTLLV